MRIFFPHYEVFYRYNYYSKTAWDIFLSVRLKKEIILFYFFSRETLLGSKVNIYYGEKPLILKQENLSFFSFRKHLETCINKFGVCGKYVGPYLQISFKNVKMHFLHVLLKFAAFHSSM